MVAVDGMDGRRYLQYIVIVAESGREERLP